MEKGESDANGNVAKAVAKERKMARLSFLVPLILFLAGISWIYYSFNQVRKLQVQSGQLNEQISQSNKQIEELDKKKKEAQEQLNDFYEAANLSGVRRQAVVLTLALQEKNIPFVMGGRSLEKGLDMSGFIIYVLSRPGIGIMNQSDLLNCNQPCLMRKTKAKQSTTLPPDLKPGDLIFYEFTTMMYLGNSKCRGMVYQKGIQTQDVNYWPIIGYSKIPYVD